MYWSDDCIHTQEMSDRVTDFISLKIERQFHLYIVIEWNALGNVWGWQEVPNKRIIPSVVMLICVVKWKLYLK